MDLVKGSHCNDILSLCRLDESSQSSASTVMSNDSHDERDHHAIQKKLLFLEEIQSYCSIDDVSTIKNGINHGDDKLPSSDFIVNAKSMNTESTLDVLETSIADVSTKLIHGNKKDATAGWEIETSANKTMYTEDELNNQELSLYHSDERLPQPELSSTEPLLPSLRKLSLLEQLDVMFEKLCFTNSVACDELVMSHGCPSTHTKGNGLTNDATYYLSSMDAIIAILGCNSPVSMYEYAYFSTFESHLLSCCGGGGVDDGTKLTMVTNPLIPTQPPIHSTTMKVLRRGRIKKRRVIQQLLLERGRTRPEIASLPQLRRSRSFSSISNDVVTYQQHRRRQLQNPTSQSSSFDIMGYFYALPKEPTSHALSRILHDDDNVDGYDSDPCLPYSKPLIQRARSPRSVLVDAPQSSQWNSNKYWYNTNLLRETVEITMNSTWNLFWMHNDKPIQVQVWIEPGTIIQNRSVMVEPSLMWRCLSLTETAATKKALIPSSNPMSLRLLQIGRVRPVTTGSGTDVPAMCRMSTSLVVRTIFHETFYFQASTIQERDSIVHQWKVTIARLATLAVLEDTTSLINEFFLDQNHNQHSYKV
jgi:hypothetical protein